MTGWPTDESGSKAGEKQHQAKWRIGVGQVRSGRGIADDSVRCCPMLAGLK